MERGKKAAKTQRQALTLVELLVVVIIIGIIATFAMPSYQQAKRKSVDKEAQTLLRLIKSAEDMYRLEATVYKECGDTAGCNSLLNLDLPVGGNWDYSVAGIGGGDTFTATAAGSSGTESDWQINQDGPVDF